MRRYIALSVLVVWLASAASFGRVAATQPAPGVARPAVTDGGITVYFSPQGGATQAVVTEIAQAKATIQVQAYSFTSADIAKALLDAHKRGVKVVAVLDKGQQTAKYSGATFLHNAGITVLIDDKHAIAHNKVMLIDGRTVITGSFNFTKAAEESNAENLLVIKGKPGLAAAYLQNFKNHLGHAVKYAGPTQADAETANEAQEQAPPAADGDDGLVHVAKSGRNYHRKGCASVANSDIPMKLADAKAAGFTACSRCRPADH